MTHFPWTALPEGERGSFSPKRHFDRAISVISDKDCVAICRGMQRMRPQNRFSPVSKTFVVLTILLCVASGGAASAASAYTLHVVENFANSPDGQLFLDPARNLFGVSFQGARSQGAVFEISPRKGGVWRFQNLYRFFGADGTYPDGSVPNAIIEDVAGNLYGTTEYGGAYDGGVIFELSPNADRTQWTAKALYNFPDLAFPSGLTYPGQSAGSLYDGVSPLYGVTRQVGAHNRGMAYSLTPSNGQWNFTDIYDFCARGGVPLCLDGAFPGGLTLDTQGNIFGATQSGGSKREGGIVFELSSSAGSWTELVLHKFCSLPKCADGMFPGSVLLDGVGNLYGTTGAGGFPCKLRMDTRCDGVVFKIALGQPPQLTVLHTFCSVNFCVDGAAPNGNLVRDASGTLYGTTLWGGLGINDGIAYSLGQSYQTIHEFCAQPNCQDGQQPNAGLVLDARGNLFGTTRVGGTKTGGVVFELKPSTSPAE